MNSKGHLFISLVKSIIRVVACVGSIVTKSIEVLAYGLLCAEVLGVLEEVVDKR